MLLSQRRNVFGLFVAQLLCFSSQSGSSRSLWRGVLLGLAQHAIADDEKLDLVAHETAEGVFRGADDRLAAHIKAGVDQKTAAGLLLEARDERLEARIGVGSVRGE